MCINRLTEERFKELDSFISEAPGGQGSLIAVLHKAQELFGYLPKEVQLYIARKLKITAARVNGVVTFYSYFTETPRGEHVINVCLGTACFVKGAEDILRELETLLEIKPGQTTGDGRFSLDGLRCVGACGLAPVVMIDDKVYGRVEEGEIAKIIKSYLH
ncbi:MAG: NADH-quinone oxidoreductase subunit NuoE [Firmicutes bacterium]|nr:NADH-quinone oxidoreductase subunit NuoE [Bacillota bacterium]